MADIKQALALEMRRSAKRELRIALRPLQEQLSAIRKVVASQRRQIRELVRATGMVPATPSKSVPVESTSDEAPCEVDPKVLARVTPRRIARLRLKLGLNQSQFARLLDVAPLSISRWEAGLTKPRAEQKCRIIRVREMGRRELKALMSDRKVVSRKGRAKKSQDAADESKTETTEE